MSEYHMGLLVGHVLGFATAFATWFFIKTVFAKKGK